MPARDGAHLGAREGGRASTTAQEAGASAAARDDRGPVARRQVVQKATVAFDDDGPPGDPTERGPPRSRRRPPTFSPREMPPEACGRSRRPDVLFPRRRCADGTHPWDARRGVEGRDDGGAERPDGAERRTDKVRLGTARRAVRTAARSTLGRRAGFRRARTPYRPSPARDRQPATSPPSKARQTVLHKQRALCLCDLQSLLEQSAEIDPSPIAVLETLDTDSLRTLPPPPRPSPAPARNRRAGTERHGRAPRS